MSELKHYGMPRRSGRYPWGSGENPYQSALGFKGMIDDMRKQGMSEVEIARGLGITTSQLRARISISKEEIRAAQVAEALRLQQKGMSNVAIGKQMGINESTVRSLLDPAKAERAAITKATVNMLKDSVSKFGYIDVGSGVENHVGVSRTKLNTAIAELVEQGYKIHYVKVEQLGIPGQYTSVKVLAGPDSTYSEVFNNKDLIQPVMGRSEDFGRTYSDLGLKTPKSINSDNIMVRYGDQGGSEKDGVIELRRGVSDLDLGDAKYAQVRIAVDGTHYLKGMAVYSDDLPEGINVIFNTNKKDTGVKTDAMKVMKDDPDNPFGSTIKSIMTDEGVRVVAQNGALNVVREEADWNTWSKNLSSQMLSKQSPALAKQQLGLDYQLKNEEYQELASLTNPTVKKQLLMSFADKCDSAAVDLKAAALPRQSTKVILPITDLKATEVYAPSYNDGETVVLIRHPHGGTFEIPQLTVNNKSATAKSVMGNALDAIGINAEVAQKLSGADFDGDTVIVIPNNTGQIRTQASLKALQNFDPKESYPAYEGMPTIKSQTMQTEMGKISNLITDMTIKGANVDEIARAVKHSMVVIDSEKHNLNYKLSYVDNGIAALSEKYQGSKRGGASTIVSRASSTVRVPERKNRVMIDPSTGEKIYTETGTTYVNKKGQTVVRQTTSTKMAETKDPYTLSSGTPMETVYANYASQMKSLANTARKEAVATQPTQYSPSAKKTYAQEVESLQSKLNVAKMNRPLERQAQIIANTVATKKIQSNPTIDKDAATKIRTQALTQARARTGAQRQQIAITPREWEAIQAGAVSTNTLSQILSNTNLDTIKQYATPRQATSTMTNAKISRAKSMMNSGYTQAEVAQALGVSVSTLTSALYS